MTEVCGLEDGLCGQSQRDRVYMRSLRNETINALEAELGGPYDTSAGVLVVFIPDLDPNKRLALEEFYKIQDKIELGMGNDKTNSRSLETSIAGDYPTSLAAGNKIGTLISQGRGPLGPFWVALHLRGLHQPTSMPVGCRSSSFS